MYSLPGRTVREIIFWSRQIGGNESDGGISIALDEEDNLYFSGGFVGIVDFNAGSGALNLHSDSGKIFISSYDKTGNFLWAENIGRSDGPVQGSQCIKVDNSRNIYLSGSFTGKTDFDPGLHSHHLICTNYAVNKADPDAFIAEFDSIGKLKWAINVGGIQPDNCRSIDPDQDGNVYATGYYGYNLSDFNYGTGIAYLYSKQATSTFLAKYGQCDVVPEVDSLTICNGEIYRFPDGDSAEITTVDTSTFLSYFGCDSTVITNLKVVEVDVAVIRSGSKLSSNAVNAGFQWLRCDSLTYSVVVGETNDEFTATTNGRCAVAIVQYNCSDTSDCIDINNAGLGEIRQQECTIYPNPTKGHILVKFSGPAPSALRVFDVPGNEIPVSAIRTSPGLTDIDLGDIPSGLYLLGVQGNSINKVFRIVKEIE